MRPRLFCNLIRDDTPAAITTASARALTSQAITRAIEPASPRTPRLDVKVQAPQRGVLTTQLYFPDDPMNRRDGLFRREAARFDFILDMR